VIYSSEQSSRRALEQQLANRASETGTEETFAIRADHGLPQTLSSPDRQWAVAYARLAREVGFDEDIHLAFQAVARVVHPIPQGKAGENARWNLKCRSGRNGYRARKAKSLVCVRSARVQIGTDPCDINERRRPADLSGLLTNPVDVSPSMKIENQTKDEED
jgi:hypothetical protein